MITEILKEKIIKRPFYNYWLKKYLGSNVIKVITWMRRVWKVFENYVFLDLKRNRYSIKIWRLSNGKEVDFIAEKSGITKYFQVCYLFGWEEAIAREYSSLEEINDNLEKYVVSFDEIDFWVSNWIKHFKIWELESVL